MITHIKRDNPSVICVFFLFGIHLYYILLFLYGYYNYIEYCMTCCVRLTVKTLVLIKVQKKKFAAKILVSILVHTEMCDSVLCLAHM